MTSSSSDERRFEVVCEDNRAASLADHQRPRGDTLESVYPLTPGSSYVVVGMLMEERVLYYLLTNDFGGPCLAPAGLFDLGTWVVPDGWRFGLMAGVRTPASELYGNPSIALWGYPEWVEDPSHWPDLVEGDERALQVFNAVARAGSPG